jgi:hypothetical protein
VAKVVSFKKGVNGVNASSFEKSLLSIKLLFLL